MLVAKVSLQLWVKIWDSVYIFNIFNFAHGYSCNKHIKKKDRFEICFKDFRRTGYEKGTGKKKVLDIITLNAQKEIKK